MAKPKGSAAGAATPIVQLSPPRWFRLLRWACFTATVAIAIGMLALLDKHLTSFPWVYDGSVKEYRGRNIGITFCLLSGSTEWSADARCNFGFATASVSLALALLWSYTQALRKDPFKHPAARMVDLALCSVWLLWWLVSAVLLCIWTDAANKAGSFLGNGKDARNGLCAMAWIEFLLVAVLAGTAALLYTAKSQGLFDKWTQAAAVKAAEKEERKLRTKQEKAAGAEAAAAAAAAKAASKSPAGAGVAGAGAAPNNV